MNYEETYNIIGDVDIYVIDQILKGRYRSGQSLLDAGCGSGRNLKWFYQNDFQIHGIDVDEHRIEDAKAVYPKGVDNFLVGKLDDLPFPENNFDHVLCCAVLHFAQNEKHFFAMFAELFRVLKNNGTLLVRMASNIGLNDNKPFVKDGVSQEISNFYLTRDIITKLMQLYSVQLIEPIKTTNVQDIRAMTTLVLQK